MQVLADEDAVARLIGDIGRWIESLDVSPERLALVGIRSRGEVLAQRLAAELDCAKIGTLDITLYRDDLTELAAQPVVRTTEVDFPLDGLDVILLDDVLMTGRSIRAALSCLMDLGRPRRVWLAVLVDRGEALRELPICPDYHALTHAGPQRVNVRLRPTDDDDAITLTPADASDHTAAKGLA